MPAAFWEEEDHPEEAITAMTYAKQAKQQEKARVRRLQELRRLQHMQLKSGAKNGAESSPESGSGSGVESTPETGVSSEIDQNELDIAAEIAKLEQQPFDSSLSSSSPTSSSATSLPSMGFRPRQAAAKNERRVVREHMSVDKSRNRNDPR